MASSRLRREIEALLYKRWRIGLDPADPRGPVLGMRTSAGHIIPRVDPYEPVYIGSDNGVLAWGSPVSYPLQVHVGTYLSNYHTAGPTVIPGSDPPRSEYLTGLIGLHPTETCSGGASLPTYSGRESEANPHDATVWDDETQGTLDGGNLRAERWSGLMRLWMQARARIGLKVLPTVPSGFVVGPERMGLIRSPGGVYWLAYAHSTGIKVARMRIAYPGTYDCTLAIANGGALSGAAQELADVEALSRLELWLDGGGGGNPHVVELFSSSATSLLDVYKATTLTTTPYSLNRPTDLLTSRRWGWVWRQQQRGATDEDTPGAAIVTYRPVWATADDFNIITRVSYLEIGFDGSDQPLGSLSTLSSDADQAFKVYFTHTDRPSAADVVGAYSTTRLYYHDGTYLTSAFSANSAYAVDPTSGPYVLDVFYDADGTLLTFEWVYPGAETTEQTTPPPSDCLDNRTGSETLYRQLVWRPAHFSFGAHETGILTGTDRDESVRIDEFTCSYTSTIFNLYGAWAIQPTTPGLIWFIEDKNWEIGDGGRYFIEEPRFEYFTVEEELARPGSICVAGSQSLALDQTAADAVLTAGWTSPAPTFRMPSLVSYYGRAIVYGADVPAGFAQSLADDVSATAYNKALCGWV